MAMKSTNIFSFTSSPLIYLRPNIQHLAFLQIRKILVYETQYGKRGKAKKEIKILITNESNNPRHQYYLLPDKNKKI